MLKARPSELDAARDSANGHFSKLLPPAGDGLGHLTTAARSFLKAPAGARAERAGSVRFRAVDYFHLPEAPAPVL